MTLLQSRLHAPAEIFRPPWPDRAVGCVFTSKDLKALRRAVRFGPPPLFTLETP